MITKKFAVSKMKRKEVGIIFHIPWKVSQGADSGSEIRPIMMLEAFQRNFFHVDIVMGSGKERLYQILKIRKKIMQGFRYSFVYSESSTYPTIIANGNKDAFFYPFLDFIFFMMCRKNNIPIALFYRDIYWKFPHSINKGIIKSYFLKILYKIDIIIYKKLINVLFLPSMKMINYIGSLDIPIKTLPPGTSIHGSVPFENNTTNLTLIYVGGLGNHYRIHYLLQAVNCIPDINLIICCREEEWQKNKKDYGYQLKSNITIKHLKGNDLLSLYQKANIGCCFFENSVYRSFAMPLKLFEYLGFYLPVIATEGTATGDFVTMHDVGWVIPYEEKALVNLLKTIKDHPEVIKQKQRNIMNILHHHSWDARVKQVCKDIGMDVKDLL
ncbi:MAG TPA: glycosyltransferase [Methanolinea sp.]|nr:glycosyltransferase [Methanolinea sp.]